MNAAVPIITASQKNLLLFSPVSCFLFTKHQISVINPAIDAIGQDIKTIVANKLFRGVIAGIKANEKIHSKDKKKVIVGKLNLPIFTFSTPVVG